MTSRHHALLIDDEPLARMELRRLLLAHPQIAVRGEAGTVNEARALLGQPGYDLVFLDVQLRGGSGFDLLDAIAPAAQVVFITAYDRYAVRAFEVNALDYLLKPVTAARLATTLLRAGSDDGANRPAAGRLAADDRVFMKSDGIAQFVPVATIAAVKSCENYTEVFLAGGRRLMVLRSLKSWEESLPAETFVRVHRQALVNLAQVRRLVRLGEDEVRLEFDPPLAPVAASRRLLSGLKHRLGAAGLDSTPA